MGTNIRILIVRSAVRQCDESDVPQCLSCWSLSRTIIWLFNGLNRPIMASAVLVVNVLCVRWIVRKWENQSRPCFQLSWRSVKNPSLIHVCCWTWMLSHTFRWVAVSDWCWELDRAAVECRLWPLVDVVGSWSLRLLSVCGSHPVTISGAVFGLSLFKYITICVRFDWF